ncbi:MAG: alginate export family protein [Bryobacteraceae bacterium]
MKSKLSLEVCLIGTGTFLLLFGCAVGAYAEGDSSGGGAPPKPEQRVSVPAGPVPDTTRSPLGGYASSPPPDRSPYDAPDTAPITQLNRELPRWLQFGLEERFRFESAIGAGFKPGNDDAYFLNRLRFGMTIQPTSWFKVLAQFQDARPLYQKPPIGPPNETRWDLKQAYVELGGSETSPVSIRVGRQIIDYNSTIFGNSEWRNQGRSYDAAVMNLHLDRYRLGIFAASVVNPLDIGISHHLQGNNVYGLYGGIERIVPKSVIEPFVLWRVAPSVAVETTAKNKTGRLNEKAVGIRLLGKDIHNFDYRVEVIGEGGLAGTNDIRAWATTMAVGYRVMRLPGVPRFFGGFDYASGDKNPSDGIHNTFDVMYPNGHDRFGITDLFGWQNIVSYRGGVNVRLHRHLYWVGQYLNLDLANATDGAYNVSGGLIARDKTGKSGTHIGESLETYVWYELNRRVSFGAGVGHFMPGTFISKVTKGAAYTYPYFVINFLDGKRLLEVP